MRPHPGAARHAWFFFVVAALFLLQTLRRRQRPHYHVEPDGFFGIDLARVLPYNLTRTWHLQLALFFVATAFLAAGIFLAPLIAGREPRGRACSPFALLGALVVVVVGSLVGEYLELHGDARGRRHRWFGAQGWEYLDLGALLAGAADRRAGPLGRSCSARAPRPAAARARRATCPGCSSTRAVDPAVLRGRPADPTEPHFAITDFWRFWVVHLWVEDFLELFTTMMVAYIFVLIGVVSERMALG